MRFDIIFIPVDQRDARYGRYGKPGTPWRLWSTARDMDEAEAKVAKLWGDGFNAGLVFMGGERSPDRHGE
jgi:hypothetical protein